MDDKQARRAAKIMATQFELLKRGSRATDYACREWLGLDAFPRAADVVNAVHAKLDKRDKEGEDKSLGLVMATLTAGRQLLKGLEGTY